MTAQIKVQDHYGINFLIPKDKNQEWQDMWNCAEIKPEWAKEVYKNSAHSEQEFCTCFFDYADL